MRDRLPSQSGRFGPGSILGSYRLLAPIGEGAVGRVYLAEHTKLGRKVALKMLKSEVSTHPKLLSRFFLEARAVNEIAHENIVSITDIVEGTDHPSFFIMELLHGLTLERLLREEGPQSARFAMMVGAQLASALGAVHSKGFIHRDLKPANIFLVPKENGYFVKLLDFGVAKLVAASAPAGANTAVGDLVGTPDYMSPEQARAAQVDHRADIYGLGTLLYEIVTGERPFPRLNLEEVLKAQIFEAPAPPSQKRPVPEPLEKLILRCLQKKPEDRPQTAAEVEATLKEMLAKSSSAPRAKSSNIGLWTAAVLGTVAIAAALYWAIVLKP